MDSLHIDMRTANSIFTRAQASAEPGLIGVLRSASGDAPRFEVWAADARDLGPDDLPVFLGDSAAPGVERHHLRVITDTRGVMQLHGYRCCNGDCREIVINTGS